MCSMRRWQCKWKESSLSFSFSVWIVETETTEVGWWSFIYSNSGCQLIRECVCDCSDKENVSLQSLIGHNIQDFCHASDVCQMKKHYAEGQSPCFRLILINHFNTSTCRLRDQFEAVWCLEHGITVTLWSLWTGGQWRTNHSVLVVLYKNWTEALTAFWRFHLVSPPRKLRSKNPKVALNLWQKLRKKIGKVALKLRAIWLIFGCKMFLWYFGKFWQQTTKQCLSILYRAN